jgi:hypothetical protein
MNTSIDVNLLTRVPWTQLSFFSSLRKYPFKGAFMDRLRFAPDMIRKGQGIDAGKKDSMP